MGKNFFQTQTETITINKKKADISAKPYLTILFPYPIRDSTPVPYKNSFDKKSCYKVILLFCKSSLYLCSKPNIKPVP